MKKVGHGGWVTRVLPSGRLEGAQHGLGNRGLGNKQTTKKLKADEHAKR